MRGEEKEVARPLMPVTPREAGATRRGAARRDAENRLGYRKLGQRTCESGARGSRRRDLASRFLIGRLH